MRAPQPGDVIPTSELDALPPSAVLIDRHGQALVRWLSGWGTDGVFDPLPDDVVVDNAPFTLVYLPGQPPRPERVVKAEALREAAAAIESPGAVGPVRGRSNYASWLSARADLIDRAENIEGSES